MTIYVHQGDLPDGFPEAASIAVDTEAMGLNIGRDRLCVVQISTGDGNAHLVQVRPPFDAPRLRALLSDLHVLKIFHFARFDVAILKDALSINVAPLYCTKIASKLARTYTDRHGLKDLCHDLLNVTLNKEVRLSDWGTDTLSEAQQTYAAQDVLYLHQLKNILDDLLAREGRAALAEKCFKSMDTITDIDLGRFDPIYIFSH